MLCVWYPPMPACRLLLTAVGLLGVVSVASAQSWTNPLVPQRADPWVIKHDDGFYYFIATAPEYDRIELSRAASLAGLATAAPTVIWRKHESGPMSAHIWAPEIHFIDGKAYVYFAAGRAEAIWDIRMYVLENASAKPLEGEWIEKGQLKTDWESFSLDATSFEHRGTRYLVWAQQDPAIKGNTNLYIAAMENPWTIRSPQVMIARPEYPWEQVRYWVNEGAAVLKRNGRIFMTYSASATDSNYCMGLLTASEDADLLDAKSWVKSPVPVFVSSDETGQYGPGHLTSADLRHWRHARPLTLASDRVIDASVSQLGDGTWRMWYKNERDGKSIYYADSPDLVSWTDRGQAVGDRGGEGPKVFRWKDAYWMITDVWNGLAVYRSDDARTWIRQPGANLLAQPGAGPDDGVKGGHADVLVSGDRAYLVYFTHPGRVPGATGDGYEQRRSSLQVVELYERDGLLTCDRDAPTYVRWQAKAP